MSDDKVLYSILNTKLITFNKNIDLILSNIKNFENKCSSALILNDNINYKKELENIKYSIDRQKQKIKRQILIEIEQKMLD